MSSDLLPVGYQQTEMGAVPDDWEFGPLEKFWSVTDCKHVTAKFISVGIPVASIQEVQSRFINLENANQTTKSYYKKLIEGGRDPRPGDLILSRNATVGEISQVASWHPPFAMGQDVCLLRKKSADYSTSLLQSVFQSWIIRNQLENCMVGSTFRRVNVEQIKNLVIPHPLKKAEQEAIATSLSDTDALIEALEQLIAKKRHIKQGTMQELLTGKRRLPGFGEGKGYKQTEIGVIPEDWSDKPLGRYIQITSGDSPSLFQFSDTGIPYFKVEQLSNSEKFLGKSSTPYYFINGRTVPSGSIIFAKRGAAIALNKVRILSYESFVDTNLMVLTPVDELNGEFLYYALGHIGLWRLADTTSIPQINNKHIKPLIFPFPPLPEQKAIATILSDMDTEIATLEAKLTKTRQLKQGMMHNLLTGRIRLV